MKKEITLGKKEYYSGKVLTFDVYDVKCPNGVFAKREIVHHPGGVCILVEVDNKIILEKQYRFPYDDFIYELPAGKLEKGEDPYKAALREMEEETGYIAESLEDYGCLYPSVGYTDEIIYLYKANNIKKSQMHLDEDEDFELLLFTKDELLEMIKNNMIKDAKTIIFLLKYFGGLKK